MIAALRSAAMLLLLVLAQPVLAHGDERHGDRPADHEPVAARPDAGPDGSVSTTIDEATARPDHEHDAVPGSVWTSIHPATVHFPIGLLLAAALAELASIVRPSTRLDNAATVMAWGGAAGAVVAALFGWIHTGLWLGGDATMQWHRWTGTGLAVVATLAAGVSMRADRRVFRALLAIMAVAVAAQGYWGGELAHGPNHLGF